MESVREVIYFIFKNPFQLQEAALHSLLQPPFYLQSFPFLSPSLSSSVPLSLLPSHETFKSLQLLKMIFIALDPPR